MRRRSEAEGGGARGAGSCGVGACRSLTRNKQQRASTDRRQSETRDQGPSQQAAHQQATSKEQRASKASEPPDVHVRGCWPVATRPVHRGVGVVPILQREDQKHYDHRPWQWALMARRSYFYFYDYACICVWRFFIFFTSLVRFVRGA